MELSFRSNSSFSLSNPNFMACVRSLGENKRTALQVAGERTFARLAKRSLTFARSCRLRPHPDGISRRKLRAEFVYLAVEPVGPLVFVIRLRSTLRDAHVCLEPRLDRRRQNRSHGIR